MAQDADDVLSESSWTALAKGKERDWWDFDLEGDMEKLEVVGPWSPTEGRSMDPKRKMGHEVKDKPKEVEMEVDGDVPQDESVEIQSLKRKVIRIESEETQDYVCETLAISKEEAEEMGFVAPLVNHEGPFTGATIDAVKKPSETGRQPQWLLEKVVKPAQSICVSSAAMKS